jgi:hypothetical protein
MVPTSATVTVLTRRERHRPQRDRRSDRNGALADEGATLPGRMGHHAKLTLSTYGHVVDDLDNAHARGPVAFD